MWLAQWAATPERQPLLLQPLSAEETTAIQAGLDSLNQPYTLVNGQIMVPESTNRSGLIAQLQQMERMPGDVSMGFAELVKDANPWISEHDNLRRWNVALQSELNRILREFRGVKSANVVLPVIERTSGMSRAWAEPSGSVTITMKDGSSVPRDLAQAAARMVAGAVKGLSIRNVQVLDGNGRVALDWEEEESGGASSMFRLQKAKEREITSKIVNQLSFDPMVRVTTYVELEHSASQVSTHTPIEGVESEVERTEEETTRAAPAGQPGVEPNTGVGVAANPTGDMTRRETNRRALVTGAEERRQDTPRGAVRAIAASINVSHSFLASIFKRNNPEAEAPTEAQVNEVFAAQKPKIINQVRTLVVPSEEQQISVDWYYDSIELGPAPAEAGAVEVSMDIAKRFGPASALVALALLSLGLVSRMARTSAVGEAFGLEVGLSKEEIEAARAANQRVNRAKENNDIEPPGADPLPMPVAAAFAAEGMLEATEIDDALVQVNNMIDQMTKMVADDPEAIATVLEKWIDS